MFESLSLLERSLDFHRDRHTVLASNLANLDTPAYVPLDLVAADPEPSGQAELARTSARHLPAEAERDRPTLVPAGDTAGADGNGVVLELELGKVDANRVRYSAAAELVSRRMALLRYGATGEG